MRRMPKGFTLLEVLVALVVLSVGMLGIGALYVASLQSARTAIIRTKAVNFAADMADRIRANRQGLAAYGGFSSNFGCADNTANATTSCTPAQMAAHDLFLWQQLLNDRRSGLPDAQAVITFTAGAPPLYEINISWTETGETARQKLRDASRNMSRMASAIFSQPLRRRRNAGFTMIELMISIALGSVILVGTVLMFQQSRAAYMVNDATSRLQENARFALDILDPDIRLASYWGATNRAEFVDGQKGTPLALPDGHRRLRRSLVHRPQ